jgi:hypothetical protein
VVKTIESGGGSSTQGTEDESRVQRSATESSPYGTESPYQTEGPETTQGGEGESRESSPYGYESNGGAGVEGAGEVGAGGEGSTGVESSGEGREGHVMIVP